MKIDNEKCTGCGICHPYCTVAAIKTMNGMDKSVSVIDQDECVECGACLRADVCPVDALYMPELEWPRSLREFFSNPVVLHPSTGVPGRGTMEMKTNDVTGRFRRGEAGVSIEMGRPGVGTSFREIQTVAMALGKAGIEFESQNPLASVMVDRMTGKLKEEVLNEKVLSAIIECKIEIDRLGELLETIKDVTHKIDTVFSLDLICRVNPDGSIPTIDIAKAAGFSPRPNTKTNIGLGRPLKEEA